MGLKITVTESGSGQRALPEEGLTLGICYQVLYLGNHKSVWNGKESWKPKVRFTFELPNLTHVFDKEKGEQPFVVSAEHNLFLNEKSNLYKFIKSWMPKTEIKKDSEIDLSKLLGKPCMINIVHNTAKNNNVYANIGSITPVMKGIEIPKLVNEAVDYDVDEHNQEVFQKLPEWLQNKICESKEMTESVKVNEEEDDDLFFNSPDGVDDDIF